MAAWYRFLFAVTSNKSARILMQVCPLSFLCLSFELKGTLHVFTGQLTKLFPVHSYGLTQGRLQAFMPENKMWSLAAICGIMERWTCTPAVHKYCYTCCKYGCFYKKQRTPLCFIQSFFMVWCRQQVSVTVINPLNVTFLWVVTHQTKFNCKILTIEVTQRWTIKSDFFYFYWFT